MKIRQATIDDSANLAKVHFESFAKAYAIALNLSHNKMHLTHLELKDFKSRWLTRLSENKSTTYVAEIDNKIAGFITITLSKSSEEILYLYISPKNWRQGIGQALMNFVNTIFQDNKVQSVIIWAMKSSQQARKFYESLGAVCTNEIKNSDRPLYAEEIKYRLPIKNNLA